ncbi:hypothetical protein LguiA_026416 [Lonicera macranthoides]
MATQAAKPAQSVKKLDPPTKSSKSDKLLPIANVGRIMKRILPPNAKISKEAKETIQECATEFVSFVASEASDKCHKENRKIVNGHDICWALISLGFDEYGEVIMKYLLKYKEFERERALKKEGHIIKEEKDEGSMRKVLDKVMEKGETSFLRRS